MAKDKFEPGSMVFTKESDGNRVWIEPSRVAFVEEKRLWCSDVFGTVIVLTNGDKVAVRESFDVVVEEIVDYY